MPNGQGIGKSSANLGFVHMEVGGNQSIHTISICFFITFTFTGQVGYPSKASYPVSLSG